MKGPVEKKSQQAAPAVAVSGSEMAGLTSEQAVAVVRLFKEQERKAERDAKLERANAARRDRVGIYEVVTDAGWNPNRVYTDLSLGEKPPLPTSAQLRDLVEITEGGWIPPDHVTRQLSEEEVAKADADGRLTLQAKARLRAAERPVAEAEESVRRIEVDIAKAEHERCAAEGRLAVLQAEKDVRKARLAEAERVLAVFFERRSPLWRKKALAQAASDRTPRREEPTAAKAHFPPRQDDSGKLYRWNPATMTHEPVR